MRINVVRSELELLLKLISTFALASQSIIIAFNVRPSAMVIDYAKEKDIEIRLYNVIYKVLEDIEAAMEGMLDPVYEEKVLGQAE